MKFKFNAKQILLLVILTLPGICFCCCMLSILPGLPDSIRNERRVFTKDAEEAALEYFENNCIAFDKNTVSVNIEKEIKRDNLTFSFKRPGYIRTEIEIISNDGKTEKGEIEIDVEGSDSDYPNVNAYWYVPYGLENKDDGIDNYCPFGTEPIVK